MWSCQLHHTFWKGFHCYKCLYQLCERRCPYLYLVCIVLKPLLGLRLLSQPNLTCLGLNVWSSFWYGEGILWFLRFTFIAGILWTGSTSSSLLGHPTESNWNYWCCHRKRSLLLQCCTDIDCVMCVIHSFNSCPDGIGTSQKSFVMRLDAGTPSKWWHILCIIDTTCMGSSIATQLLWLGSL